MHELQLALATESSARETAIEDTTSELRAAHASLREELLHGDARHPDDVGVVAH